MSRHRGVRNLENNDEYHDDGEYGSSYGSSYCDEISLSASVERDYMYRRNASGTSPKISHFFGRSSSVESVPEEDEDRPGISGVGGTPDSDDECSYNRRHSSGSSLLEGLSDEEQIQLAKCLESILDVVGDSMAEMQVKETIVRCEFDADLALNTLLNNPMGSSSSGARQVSGAGSRTRPDRRHLQPQPTPWSPPAADALPNVLSPAVVPKQKAFGYAEAFLPTEDPKAASSSNVNGVSTVITSTSTQATAPAPSAALMPTAKKANRLNIRSRSPSPGNSNTPASAVTSGSSVKMRKAKIDPSEIYDKERGSKADVKAKDLLNLVVVGHVDSGKSTLMGHLLVELGQVSSRVMHKYENESKKLGKASFAYAWVLDETSEERERGITMDVGHSAFETSTKTVTLLDAPGHRDFIPNMISGAYQADVAMLVVNATRGEFEAGFDSGGQTREHALLVRSLGVSQLIVAVNKLDTVQWSEERFKEIIEKLWKFLKQQVGFKESDVTFVPVSGLSGVNLVNKKDVSVAWMSDNVPTLIEAIDKLRPPTRSIEKSFRMSVSDIFKPTAAAGGGFCVAGRIETGYVQKNDSIILAPLNEIATVKAVMLDNLGAFSSNNNAFAGDHVSLTLSGGIDQMNVCQGMILCDPSNPVKVSRHFAAKVVVLNVDIPITKGFNCVLHHAGVTEVAVVKKLVSQLNKTTGEVIKKKPRVLAKNSSAMVEIMAENVICLETYAESKELGRFMLRIGGKTIAAGMVTEIF